MLTFIQWDPWYQKLVISDCILKDEIVVDQQKQRVLVPRRDGLYLLDLKSMEVNLEIPSVPKSELSAFKMCTSTRAFVIYQIGRRQVAKMWDIRQHKEIWHIDAESGICENISTSIDGERLALSGKGGYSGCVYEAASGAVIRDLKSYIFGESVIVGIEFSPDNRHLCAITEGQTRSFLTDLSTAPELVRVFENWDPIERATYSHRGDILVCVDTRNNLRLLSSEGLFLQKSESGIPKFGEVSKMRFSTLDRMIVIVNRTPTGSAASQAIVLRTETLESVIKWPDVVDVDQDYDETLFLLTRSSGSSQILDANGNEIYIFNKVGSPILRCIFGANINQVIFLTAADVQIWVKRRPEAWWGIAWLPSAWITTSLFFIVLASSRYDRRKFGRASSELRQN